MRQSITSVPKCRVCKKLVNSLTFLAYFLFINIIIWTSGTKVTNLSNKSKKYHSTENINLTICNWEPSDFVFARKVLQNSTIFDHARFHVKCFYRTAHVEAPHTRCPHDDTRQQHQQLHHFCIGWVHLGTKFLFDHFTFYNNFSGEQQLVIYKKGKTEQWNYCT